MKKQLTSPGEDLMVDQEIFYREVGRNIKARRDELGLSQEALASQISLTRTSITNIEKGRQKFLLHTFMDIASALGVPAPSLLPKPTNVPKDGLEAKLKDLPLHKKTWVRETVEPSTG